ncbi:MAG: hypothetical protein PHR30_18730 [Gallionellaceae bacterium]|nr:hypothetical protein [Gallionellaceae bacterium]
MDALLRLLIEAESSEERRALAGAVDAALRDAAMRDRMTLALVVIALCAVVVLAVGVAIENRRIGRRLDTLEKLGKLPNVP